MIRDGECTFLIDAGGSKSLIRKMAPDYIDIAICTHNDADHSNGFIGLLSDSNKDINEIWLPGMWQPILSFYIEKSPEFRSLELDFKKIPNYDSLVSCREQSIADFDEQVLEKLQGTSITHHPFPFYLEFNHAFRKIILNMKRILDIARLASKRGCKIRWFEPIATFSNYNIGRFNALNSRPLQKSLSIRNNSLQNFFYLLYLTSENKYSLVFEYLKDSQPIVLFTADSDLSFLDNKMLLYKDSIIVTAPHHGSESNSQAYSLIVGNNITFVRSDRKASKRPRDTYKGLQANKYCTSCTIKLLRPNRIKFG